MSYERRLHRARARQAAPAFVEQGATKPEAGNTLDQHKPSQRRIIVHPLKDARLGYRYENADTRDAFNRATIALGDYSFIGYAWERNGYLVKDIWLIPDRLEEIYHFIGRMSPDEERKRLRERIYEALPSCSASWVHLYLEEVTARIEAEKPFPAWCKKGEEHFAGMLNL
ncbi:MAG: hypothetical protein RR178_03590, partial [Gordonibacter sp.]